MLEQEKGEEKNVQRFRSFPEIALFLFRMPFFRFMPVSSRGQLQPAGTDVFILTLNGAFTHTRILSHTDKLVQS